MPEEGPRPTLFLLRIEPGTLERLPRIDALRCVVCRNGKRKGEISVLGRAIERETRSKLHNLGGISRELVPAMLFDVLRYALSIEQLRL